MVRAEGEGALTQVGEALCDTHTEQVVGVLSVVHSQLTEHGRQTGVVRTCEREMVVLEDMVIFL